MKASPKRELPLPFVLAASRALSLGGSFHSYDGELTAAAETLARVLDRHHLLSAPTGGTDLLCVAFQAAERRDQLDDRDLRAVLTATDGNLHDSISDLIGATRTTAAHEGLIVGLAAGYLLLEMLGGAR